MDDDAKVILWTIIVITCIFAGLLIFKNLALGNAPATLDDFHQQNIEGKASDSNYVYNGFSFVKMESLWYTQVQQNNTLYDIPLHFGPREIENLTINGKLDRSFFKKEIYVTFNPVDENLQYVALGAAELSLNLAKGLGVVPRAACDRNQTTACSNSPIITCADGKPAIYIKQADSESVELKGNCAVLSGKDMGILMSVDRLLLLLYGIMP